MKILITFLIAILLSGNIYGQFQPGCNDLTVENIQMDDDTANLMKVTISNSCSTCMSGLQGCVYDELRVIRTIPPFDTIAASNCHCLWSPDNNSQTTYSIYSSETSIPPISDIRVSLMDCECDTIPFSLTLGILSNEISDSFKIYPNPVNDFIMINTSATDLTIRLTDLMGRVWYKTKLQPASDRINVAHLSNGLYIIEILDGTKNTVRSFKITKG